MASPTVSLQLVPTSQGRLDQRFPDGDDSETVPGLPENATTVFVDPDNGSDSYNGLYGEFQSGSDGPLATLNGVNALDLSTITAIYILVGTTITCEDDGDFFDEDEFRGSPGTYAVFGAYYLSSGVPYRGLNGLARPIIQGTAARPHDYDGANVLGYQNVYPEAEPTRQSFNALVGSDPGSSNGYDGWNRVENLHVRHSGGRGIFYRYVNYIQIVNCVGELCLASGIRGQDLNDILIDGCYVTGCCASQEYYGFSSRPHALSLAGNLIRGTVRNCVSWQNWGESMGCGNGLQEDCLWEDNVSFDNKHILWYADAAQRLVLRRNLLFMSGRDANNYSDVGGASGFSLQAGERNQFPPLDPDTDRSEDMMIYGNIIIGASSGVVFWDSYSNQTGQANGDFGDMYIFRNTFIDCVQEMGEINAAWTADNGRIWDNMFLTFDDTAHEIENGVPRGTWDEEDNAFNGSSGLPSWTGNITGTMWTGDTSGWDSLESLGTWSADDHIELANVDAFITAVKAKLGGPDGSAVGGGHSTNGHAASITIASFDDTDFNGDAYSTDDVGAIAD